MATRAIAATGLIGVALAIVLSAWPVATSATSGINPEINFQGKVVNTDGTNVPDGPYSFTFSLYTVATGGTALWTDTETLTVTAGIFQYNLGSNPSFPLPGSVNFDSTPLYLGMNFNSNGEMSPRIQFTAAPYAFDASNADNLGGIAAADYAQLSPSSAQSGSLNVTGDVEAGTALQAPLVDTATSAALDIGTGMASSVTIGRTSTPFLIQGNASSTLTSTSGANITTLAFATPSGTTVLTLPTGTGTICTTVASTCSSTYATSSGGSGGYLAKNAADTSNAAITASNYLYGFTNSNPSPTTGGVLDLNNDTNTGDTLYVTSAGNPAASTNALVVVNNTNGTPSGNLVDLQNNGSNELSVDYDGNITQNGGSSTTDTINGQTISGVASFTGTVGVATEVYTPKVDTASAGTLSLGTTNATTINLGNTTGTTTTNIQGGANGSTATVSVQAASAGVIALGTVNANTIQLGAIGSTTQSSTIQIANTNNATGTQSVTIGSTANTANTVALQGGATTLDVGNSGATIQNAGSATAFQVSNGSANLVQVDTTNNNIDLGGNDSGALQPFQTAGNVIFGSVNRFGATSVTNDGFLYEIGGSNSSSSAGSNTSVYYTPLQANGSVGTWVSSSNTVPTALYRSAAVVANGYVYVIGGQNTSSSNVSTVYYAKLNASGSVGAWQSGTAIPSAMDNLAAVTANGYIYIVGGGSGNAYYAQINPDGSIGSWTTDAHAPPASRVNPTAVTANGYIYELGGNNLGTVYFATLNADGSTSTWTTATNALPSPELVEQATSVVANGYVYYMGGTNNGSNTGVQQDVMYAPLGANGQPGSWVNETNNFSGVNGRWAATSVVDNGYVYVIAGNNSAGNNDSVLYASTQRVEVGGALDLVGYSDQTLAAGGSQSLGSAGGSLTAGDIDAVGNLTVEGQSDFAQGVSDNGTLTVNGAAAFQNTTNSATAFEVQEVSGTTNYNVFSVNTSTGQAVLGTSNEVPGSLVFEDSGSGNGGVMQLQGTLSGTATYDLPNVAGTQDICTTLSTADCDSVYEAAGSYLLQNPTSVDTSTSTYAGTGYQYNFTQSGTAGSGNLQLSNAGTGDALDVVGTGNPSTTSALVVINNTAVTPSGNSLDLQNNGTNEFSVDYDGNVTQNGGTSTTDTINGQTISAAANFTGTVTAATSVLTPILDTASAGTLTVGNTHATSISIGNTTSNIATTINGTAKVQPTSGNDSTTAFTVNDASTNQLLNVDSVNNIASLNGGVGSLLGNNTANNWSTTTSLTTGTAEPSVVEANGYVYYIGGASRTVEYSRINTNGTLGSWTSVTSDLPQPIFAGEAVAANGYIYLIGGSYSGTWSNLVYYAHINNDGSLGTWQTEPAADNLTTALRNTAGGVSDGYIYVVGGLNSSSAAVGTVYYAKLLSGGGLAPWTTSANSLVTSSYNGSVIIANGYIYYLGGFNSQTHYEYSQLSASGSNGAWTSVSTSSTSLYQYNMSFEADGTAYVVGGYNGTNEVTSIEQASLGTGGALGTWSTATSSLPTNITGGVTGGIGETQSVTDNGYAYVIGGLGANGSTAVSTSYYVSLPRTEIAGSLDLVGLNSTGNLNSSGSESEGDESGSLTAGNTSIIGTLQVQDTAAFNQAVSVNGSLTESADATFADTTNSATAFQVQNASGTDILTVNTSAGNTVLGTANTQGGALVFEDGASANSATLQLQGTLSGSGTVYELPNASNTTQVLCSNVAATCNTTYEPYSSTGYLAKNAADTSSAAIGSSNYLYGFTNSSSAVASGVLQLNNGSNTGDGLYVTASGNPAGGSALIVANTTAGSPSGNLLDLQDSSTSEFNVSASGNVTQNGGTGTTDTINGQTISSAANFTGTVTAVTEAYAPKFDTQTSGGTLAIGTVNAATINEGTASNTTGINLGNSNSTDTVTIQGGTNGSTPTVSIQAASTGVIALGTASANTIELGNVGSGTQSSTIEIANSSSPTGTQAVTIGSTANTANTVALQGGGTTLDVGNSGATVQNTSSATAFQVNNGTANLLQVDTANNNIDIGGNNSGALQPWATNSSTGLPAVYKATSVESNGYVYVMGGENSSGTSLTSVYYAALNTNGSVGNWTSSGNTLPTALDSAESVVANGYVYVIGGYNSSSSSSVATVYYAKLNSDGSIGSWNTTTSLSSVVTPGLYRSESVVANGYLYVLGGYNSATPGAVNTVYYAKLNPNGTIGSWTTNSTTLPTINYVGTSTVANGYVYVMGGVGSANQTGIYSAPLNLNGSIGTWTTSSNQIQGGGSGNGRYDAAGVAANGYTYIIGGTNGSAPQLSVLYAPLGSGGTNGTWTAESNTLPANRTYATSVIANGYVYLIAGGSTANASSVQSSVYYASTQRIEVGGSLDLVGLAGQTLTSGDDQGDGSTGGSITAGDITAVGTLQVEGQGNFAQGISANGNLAISGYANFENSTNSSTAFQVENSSGNNVLSVSTSGSSATLGNVTTSSGQGVDGQLIFADGSADGDSATLELAAALGGTGTVYQLPSGSSYDSTQTICTTVASSCSSTYAASGAYLLQNPVANDASTSNFAGYQYSFTQSNTGAAGNLSLTNAGTGDALSVTGSGNPSTGTNALLVVNNTNGTPSGNLLDLQKAGANVFSVDYNGNVTQNGGTSTTDTINGQTISAAASFTGTVTAATSFLGTLVDTPTSGGTLALGTTNATGGIDLNQTTTVASGKNFSIANGQFSQTYTGGAAANAQTLQFTNSVTSGAGVTVQGINITPTNNTPGSGTNTLNGENFAAAGGTPGASVVTNGINFASATGYTNFIKTPTAVLTSGGALTGLTGIAMASGNLDVNSTIDTLTGTALDIAPAEATSVVIGATGIPVTMQGNGSSTITATSSGHTTTVGFVAPTGTNAINFPNAGGTICTTVASTCGGASGAYVALQGSSPSAQTGYFDITGTGIAGTLQAANFDTPTGTATMNIGLTSGGNATAIDLNQSTTVATGENLTVTSGTTSLTGTTQVNTTGSGTTSIGGTGAGAVALASGSASSFAVTGNNLTLSTLTSGTLAVNSAGALNLTGAAASTLNVGASTLAITSAAFNVSTTGVITLAGGNSPDITTPSAGTPTGLTVQPGTATTAAHGGAGVTINAGTGDTTGAGGSLLLQGGTGGTSGAGGSVTVAGGTGGGTGGGSANLQGGAPSSVVGSAGGGVSITGATGQTGSGAATPGGTAGTVGITSGSGGAGTGTNSAGAAGGNLTESAGNGGASTGNAANSNGGNVSLTAGSAGTGGTGAAGAAGTITLQGGTAAGAGTGGLATIQGGAASATAGSAGGGVAVAGSNGAAGSGATAGGAAGAVAITSGNGGAGSGSTSSGGAGANVGITAGNGGNATSGGTNGSGGSITIAAGSAGTGGTGGVPGVINLNAATIADTAGTLTLFNTNVNTANVLQAATAIGFGASGTVITVGNGGAGTIQATGQLTLQSAAATAANSSNVVLQSGTTTTSGTTGTLTLTSGNSAAASGAVTLESGNAASGTAGTVTIDNGTSSTGTPIINIGNSAINHTINVGTGAATEALTVGSENGSSTTTIQGGTTSTAISLQTGADGTVSVSGTAPGTSGVAGTNASTQFTATGAAGGATSSTSATAGIGGGISLQGGTGGAATAATGTGTGGAGGAIAFTSGTGGSATTAGSGGAGGNISLTAANGGNGTVTNGNGGSVTIKAGAAGTGGGSAGAAGAINLQGNTVNVGTVGASLLQNNGATANTACAYSITANSTLNTAGETVNVCTAFDITATGGGPWTVTPPAPNAGAGSIIYISNLSASTNPISLVGASTNPLNPGSTATLVYNGSAWTFAGSDSSNLQADYNDSGTTSPQITLTSADKGLYVDDNATPIGATLFGVGPSTYNSASTLGAGYLAVTSTAVQLTDALDFTGVTGNNVNQTIQVTAQPTATDNGNNLQVIAAAGNTSGTGGNLLLVAGAGGTSGIGGAASLTGGAGGGGNTTGGLVTVQGGAAAGGGAGGGVSILGGVPAATAGSQGGAITITAGAGTTTGAGAAGNTVTISGGAGEGTGNNAGGAISVDGGAGANNGVGGDIDIVAGNSSGTGAAGNIHLTAGNAGGTGTPGVVYIDTPVFTSSGTTDSFSTSNTMAVSLIDNNSTEVVDATANGLTLSIPAPTNNAIGRTEYITVANGSDTFTMSLAGGPSLNMLPDTTAALVYNGTAWTGGSAASSLQQVYNDTSTTPASILTTSSTKTIQIQAGSGDDSAALFTVDNSVGEDDFNVGTATPNNYVLDPDFEQATSGTPTDWSSVGSPSTFTQNTTGTDSYEDQTSLHLVTTATAGGGASTTHFTSGLPTGSGTTYTVSFEAMMSTGTLAASNLKAALTGGGAPTCTGSASETINANGFQQVSCTFAATTGTITALTITSQASAIENLYIDAVQLSSNGLQAFESGQTELTGVIINPMSIQNATNSTSEFQVQNVTGSQLFDIDSLDSNIIVGNSTNNETFGSTFEPTLNGTARHAETINLTAEYGGAVLDTGGQSSVTGTMTAAFDSTNFVSYYSWTTSQATAQTYDIVARVPIPSNWGAWNGNPTFKDELTSTAAGDSITVESITNSSNAADATFGTYTITPGTINTWTNFSSNSLASSGYTAGGIMTIRIRLSAINNNSVNMADITIPYLAKF